MKNSLAMHYAKQLDSLPAYGNSERLKGELAEIKDLPSLKDLITRYRQSEEHYVDRCCLFSYAPFKLNLSSSLTQTTYKIKLKTWEGNLKQIQELEVCVKQKLLFLHTSGETQIGLVTFLTQLLNSPQSLLHINSLGLLNKLNDQQFEKALEYLTNLPIAPPPVTQTPGDFLQLKPKSKEHTLCLSLLNNNAATFDEGNPLSIYTNNLLQSCLAIFNDLSTNIEPMNEKTQNFQFR